MTIDTEDVESRAKPVKKSKQKGQDQEQREDFRLLGIPFRSGVSFAQIAMTACGSVLVLAGAYALMNGLVSISDGGSDLTDSLDAYGAQFAEKVGLAKLLFLTHSQTMMYFMVGIVSVLLGAGLMRRAVAVTAKTIPDEDRILLSELIQRGEEKSIGQYVRLSSLTGTTGVFTRLGFTGLPLATAALGILLVFLALYQAQDDPHSDLAAQLMDLAKLVIGAFIGSFVQRKVSGDKDLDKSMP